MAKQQPSTPIAPAQVKLSKEELRALDAEVTSAGGPEKWLEKMGAVRLDNFGKIVAVKDYGRNGEHDFPYAHLSEKLQQLSDYKAQVEYAKNKEIFEQTGEWPVNTSLKEARARVNKIFRRTSQ